MILNFKLSLNKYQQLKTLQDKYSQANHLKSVWET
jgi:hypothetical protein